MRDLRNVYGSSINMKPIVNVTKVSCPMEIKHGDIIQIGQTKIIVNLALPITTTLIERIKPSDKTLATIKLA